MSSVSRSGIAPCAYRRVSLHSASMYVEPCDKRMLPNRCLHAGDASGASQLCDEHLYHRAPRPRHLETWREMLVASQTGEPLEEITEV